VTGCSPGLTTTELVAGLVTTVLVVLFLAWLLWRMYR
jgi:flagellar biogenesis protein FliO